MYLGIDVGGTNTDGVLLSENFSILKAVKVPTEKNTLKSLNDCLQKILKKIKKEDIKRLTISTTLALNALLQNKNNIGLIVTSGPGLNPNLNFFGSLAYLAQGWQDHRGVVLKDIKEEEIINITEKLLKKNVESIVIASKFAPKNNILENKIADIVHAYLTKKKIKISISKASEVCGQLNFLARINTAYFNAAAQKIYNNFLKSVAQMLQHFNLNCPIYILKADGGHLKFKTAKQNAIKTILAGPAASLMGLWSLSENNTQNILMVDIGGSTTDLALLTSQGPLLSSGDFTLKNQTTLIRSLVSHSIALGGDCILNYNKGLIEVLPQRLGPAIALSPNCLNKRPPTLADALNVLNLSEVGNKDLSQKALQKYFPNADIKKISQEALNFALKKIHSASLNFINKINAKPRYTVNEILLTKEIKINKIFILGAIAKAFKEEITKKFKLEALVPQEASFANALGTALSQENTEVELFADTQTGILSIPELNIKKEIKPSYKLENAVSDLKNALQNPENFQIMSQEVFTNLNNSGLKSYLIKIRGGKKTSLLSFLKKENNNV